MDFTQEGNIIIEDNNMDGAVLGHAVALGENDLEAMMEAEVDTTPRTLTTAESIAAVYGLTRIEQMGRSPVFASSAVRYGGCVLRRALNQRPHAVDYLTEIAFQTVAEEWPSSSRARSAA